MNLRYVQSQVESLYRDYQQSVRQCKDETEKLQTSVQRLDHLTQARSIAQEVAEAIQMQAHEQIAGVVTECLQLVFGPDYAFKINFSKKRGRTEANLVLLRKGHEIEDPLNEDSGGVVDIASFALRLSCMVLTRPALRRILILDEPFKNVHSAIYRERVREMIEKLSEQFKVQFVIVTGIDDFVLGKVVTL